MSVTAAVFGLGVAFIVCVTLYCLAGFAVAYMVTRAWPATGPKPRRWMPDRPLDYEQYRAAYCVKWGSKNGPPPPGPKPTPSPPPPPPPKR